jgi:predicted ferric reductase
MAEPTKQTFSIEDVDPQFSAGAVFAILLAVIAGAVTALFVLQIWLPGFSQSILSAQPKVFWYLSRGSAFVAYILLWFSMVLGVGVTNKMAARWPGLAKANDLHQYVSILGLAFGLFHGLILLGDQYMNFSVLQIFLPFSTTNYQPFAVGVGQIAFYLWGVILISFYVRKRIGTKIWRAIHYFSYLSLLGALIHGIIGGTDAVTTWATVLYWSTGAILLFLTTYRVINGIYVASERKSKRLVQN